MGTGLEWSTGKCIGTSLAFDIHYLLDSLNSKGKLFATDAKFYGRVRSDQYRDLLQDDLNKLNEWSMKWRSKQVE